jgi:hypothetical protein
MLTPRKEVPPSPRPWALAFAGLAALVVALAVGMHIHRMAGMAFTNLDDMLMGLTADRMRFHWWPAYTRMASDYSLWQGRVYFYFSMIFFILPFFLRSLFWRAVLSALLQLAATCSVGAVVGLYAGFRTAALFVALACACLPYWRVSPINGFPFVYHLPVILFFSGLAVYIRRVRGQGNPAWRRLGQVFSWSAFGLSLFFYEALIPLFFLIALTVAAAEAHRVQGNWNRHIVVRAWTPWLAGFALWAAIYLGFRWLNPSTYGGSALAGVGRGDLGTVANSLYYFEAYSLPGANWMGNWQRTASRWTGTPESLGYGGFFWQNLTPDGIVLAVAILAMALCWFLSFQRETEAPPRRVGEAAALALACAVLCPLPLAFTAKYRSLETVLAVAPYLPGYYSFLAWCVVLALAFPLVGFAWRGLPALRRVAIALLALVCAAVGAANAMSNQAIYREFAEVTDKWKLVDLLGGSRWFAGLPSGSVFIAPGFWDTFPTPTWPHGDAYWSAYFSGWVHRPVQVIRDPHRIPDLLSRRTPVFYGEHQWLPGRLDAVLIVDPIREISPTDGNFGSDSLLLISRFDSTGMVVEYRSSAPDGGGPLLVRIPEARLDPGGGYIAQLPIPGLIAGTARLTDPEPPPPPDPILEFQHGFSAATERSGDGHYWRWSEGKDGEGELDLVNLSSQPVAVRFRASLLFHPQENARRTAFDFILPYSSETIGAAPGDTIERVWQLAPGSNRILVKCHAGRLPTPGDSRYIVFGVQDWSVVPVNGDANPRGMVPK